MSVKRTVLESLTRQRLVDLARGFEADFAPSVMSKGDLIDGLARLKRTALEQLLPELSRDELKAAMLGPLFYTMQIPVCLGFLANKTNVRKRSERPANHVPLAA